MARPKDLTKYEKRICIHESCNNEFEVYKKLNKRYCSKRCSNTSKIMIDRKNISLQQTIDVKYNGTHYMNNKKTQSKHKKTMLERYGVKHALQNDNIMNAVKQKFIEKYGVDNPSKHPNIISKIRRTKLERYGDENYHNVDRLHDMVYEKFLEWKHITPLFDRENFTGVDDRKYKFKCNKCDRILYVSTDNGYIPSCKVCNTNIVSRGEIEVIDYIKTIYSGEIIEGDRNILNGKELDIYLPELGVAIEYNGLYWHSELGGNKNKYYHLGKTEICNNKDIKLIHIFEHEWLYKQDIIKSVITSLLKNNIKIYARKCTVREIDVNSKNTFLSKYHIQSYGRSSIKLGLFHEDKLLSVMTFGKSRFDKRYNWEIIRFATESGYTIVGGASKLLKYFVSNYNPGTIITYADRRFGIGNVYKLIGFEFVNMTPPSYYYIKGLSVYSRFQFQKHKLESKLEVFDVKLTEWENMIMNGYDRIWDCGNLKYALKI